MAKLLNLTGTDCFMLQVSAPDGRTLWVSAGTLIDIGNMVMEKINEIAEPGEHA